MDLKHEKPASEISLFDFFRLIRKRSLLLISVFSAGFILLTLFFVFRYPPQALNLRIYSDDLGGVFEIISPNVRFLSTDKYNRLIEPVIKLNRDEGKNYEISVRETEIKKSLEDSQAKVLDLLITARFPKHMKNPESEFRTYIADFFLKLEGRLFTWYVNDIRMKRINLVSQIFKINEALRVDNKKIVILEKYLKTGSDRYKDILDRSPYYLPPSQQYTGLLIERDHRRNALELLQETLNEYDVFLKRVEDKRPSIFPALMDEPELRELRTLNDQLVSINHMLKALRGKYAHAVILKEQRIETIYIMILAYFFLAVFSLFFVIMIDWWTRNRDHIFSP